MSKTYSLDEIGHLCEYWSEVLGLFDWDIRICIARGHDFEDGAKQGNVDYVLTSKQAIIKILDPVDYCDCQFEQDQEKTLVHELLHLKFSFIDSEDKLIEKIQHTIIDDLAKSFVKIKREQEVE